MGELEPNLRKNKAARPEEGRAADCGKMEEAEA